MDKGDGRFEVAYTVTTAGPVSIAASLPGQAGVRLFEAQCEAAGAALGRCTVAAVAEALVAGDTGALVFWQADRCAADMHCSCVAALHAANYKWLSNIWSWRHRSTGVYYVVDAEDRPMPWPALTA